MIIDKSVIEWRDMSEKPLDSWDDVLLVCKTGTGCNIFPAHWSKNAGRFEDESYPFAFDESEILFWAYYPKVDNLLLYCEKDE